MVNHLKVLLRAKEFSGNLHFGTFFHIERNLNLERNNTPQLAASSCVCSRLHFSPQNHGVAQPCCGGSSCSPELPALPGGYTTERKVRWANALASHSTRENGI